MLYFNIQSIDLFINHYYVVSTIVKFQIVMIMKSRLFAVLVVLLMLASTSAAVMGSSPLPNFDGGGGRIITT